MTGGSGPHRDADRDAGPHVGEALKASALGACPRCGARSIFAGWARFAEKCDGCGLDYSRFNVGDGPAAFLTLLIGALITGLAIWLDISVEPPFWVHVLLWVPLSVALVVGGLRIAKGMLLIIEYHRGAREAGGSEPGPREPKAGDGP